MCGCNIHHFSNLVYTFRNAEISTLEERRGKVIAGRAGRKLDAVSPFESLSSEKLLTELSDRKLLSEIKEEST